MLPTATFNVALSMAATHPSPAWVLSTLEGFMLLPCILTLSWLHPDSEHRPELVSGLPPQESPEAHMDTALSELQGYVR